MQVFFHSARRILKNAIEHSANYVIEHFLKSNAVRMEKDEVKSLAMSYSHMGRPHTTIGILNMCGFTSSLKVVDKKIPKPFSRFGYFRV
ncbi:hypothetical protein SPBRAN_297 [uncultured Candidatus Thioglobus sp.]|nr:hypothetical protein SPBRAN_297 [uncultured Candidatus Thioglobus sp.]